MSLTSKYAIVFKIKQEPAKKTITAPFKSIGRDQKYAFENRLKKDFYDPLPSNHFYKELKAKSDNFSNLGHKKQTVHEFKLPDLSQSMKQSRALSTKESEKFSVSISRPSKSLNKNSLANLFNNAEQKTPKSKKEENKLGLSTFEYKNTIFGKVSNRYSHHIDFTKTPDRPNYLKKAPDYEDINVRSPKQKFNQMNKIHSFRSDSPHQGFPQTPKLDKIYNSIDADKTGKSRPDLSVRKFDSFSNRPQIPKKMSTQLNYETGLNLLNSKRPIFQLFRKQRQLAFSRQIISNKSGSNR